MQVDIQTIEPEQTYTLRHTVLWPDKPLAYVHIAEDAEGHHYGAFVQGKLVSVISLFVQGTDGRFRKFATDPAWQRQGVGSQLLHHTIAQAQHLGAHTLWCDARQDAAAFYERFGMQPEGDIFFKGEIPYVRMQLALA